MRQIKIINGTYGFRPTPAVVETKTPESPAFFVEDQEAERLVNLGVAAYITFKAEPAAPAEEQQEEAVPETSGEHLDPAQLEEMNYNDLKKLAADMGVKPEGKTKADYIAAIAAAEVEHGEEDPEDELPELTAADPE